MLLQIPTSIDRQAGNAMTRNDILLPSGVRLAVSPLSWANDVLEDLGADIPLETCLRDAAETG
ncbi:hypothetical protein [Mesorhizobium sp. ORS 3428]|uniref:hypothetical protein n=1 Tax=Mesorhizobium sp. ORS 3428 TaxID=540997 RepID=UPI001FCD0E8B|nr:hypothetical protein [Mesorhizobium sp. ORS 3428]